MAISKRPWQVCSMDISVSSNQLERRCEYATQAVSFIHSNCSLSLPGSSPLLLFPTDPSHEHPRTQSQRRRRPTNQISSITKHKAASHGSMKNPPGTRFQGPPTKKPEITSALLISSKDGRRPQSATLEIIPDQRHGPALEKCIEAEDEQGIFGMGRVYGRRER